MFLCEGVQRIYALSVDHKRILSKEFAFKTGLITFLELSSNVNIQA